MIFRDSNPEVSPPLSWASGEAYGYIQKVSDWELVFFLFLFYGLSLLWSWLFVFVAVWWFICFDFLCGIGGLNTGILH